MKLLKDVFALVILPILCLLSCSTHTSIEPELKIHNLMTDNDALSDSLELLKKDTLRIGIRFRSLESTQNYLLDYNQGQKEYLEEKLNNLTLNQSKKDSALNKMESNISNAQRLNYNQKTKFYSLQKWFCDSFAKSDNRLESLIFKDRLEFYYPLENQLSKIGLGKITVTTDKLSYLLNEKLFRFCKANSLTCFIQIHFNEQTKKRGSKSKASTSSIRFKALKSQMTSQLGNFYTEDNLKKVFNQKISINYSDLSHDLIKDYVKYTIILQGNN